jgi:hypothetical protein
MSIKSSLALLAAVQAAGFTITKDKAIDTHDGYAWHATLSFGKKPIVTVSNGGFGGPDEFEYHLDQKEADLLLQPLAAIEAVASAVREGLIRKESYSFHPETATEAQKAAFEQKTAEIRANPAKITEDDLGSIVDDLRAAKALVRTLRRKCSTKLVWLVKDPAFANYTYEKKGIDTPLNREALKNSKDGADLDCFVADLLIGL